MTTGASADVIKGDTGRVIVREEGHVTTKQRDIGRCCPAGCEGRERGQEPTDARNAALETAGGKEGDSPLKPMKSPGSCWVLLVKAIEDRRGLITNLRRCVKTKGSLKEHISIKRFISNN